jgi:hypothetical protein
MAQPTITLTMSEFMNIAPRNLNWLSPRPDVIAFSFPAELLEHGVEPPAYTNPEALGAWFNGYLEGITAAQNAITAVTDHNNNEKEQ